MKEDFDHLSNAQLLALCIYGEARGESTEGKIAVGSVVLERVRRQIWFGKTITEVILKPYQFSCFLENDPNYKKLVHIADQWDEEMVENISLNDCYTIAAGLLNGNIEQYPKATHYHTKDIKTQWDDDMAMVAQIGAHLFYV